MYSRLKLGDLLYRSKDIAQHAGVYLGNGQVFHNQPDQGASITSYTQYTEGKVVNVITAANIDPQLLTERLLEIIGNDERYHFLANNCEHAANYIIYGRKLSPQIQAIIIGAIFGGLIGGQSKGSNWLLGLAFGGMAGLLIANATKKYDYCCKGLPLI